MRDIFQRIRRLAAGDFMRHGAVIFLGLMALNLSNYAFHFFMTRFLGPISYGVLSSLLALTGLLSVPSAVLTLVVVKYSSELHALNDKAKLYTLLREIATLSGMLAGGILIICIVARGGIAQYLRETDVLAVAIVGVIVAIGLMNPGLRGVLQGTQDFAALGFTMAIEGLGKCTFGVALVVAGFGIRGALLGYAVGCALSLAYAVGKLLPYRNEEPAPLRLNARRLIQSSFGIGIAIVCLQVASFFDVILVKHYFAPSEAGIYSAVALAGKVVLFVVAFVPSVVLPKAAARASQGKRATSVLLQGLGLSAAISLAILAIMFLEPTLVMRAFSGSAYVSGASFLPLYAVAMMFLAAASTVANYQIGLHRFHFIAPLLTVFAGEVFGIVAFHATIRSVILILMVGNASLLASCFYVPSRVRAANRVLNAQPASLAP